MVLTTPMQHTRRENPAYLQYIREQMCLFCGAAAPSDPHHWNGRGAKDEKRNDYETIPVCRKHHDEWHSLGPDTFMYRIARSRTWLATQVAGYLVRFFSRPDQSGGPI